MQNWSVKNKLAVGFSTVIVMALVLGIIALTALHKIATTVDKQQRVDNFNSYITQAGNARREYMAGYDEKDAAKAIDALSNALEFSKNNLEADADQQETTLLQKIEGYINNYTDIFGKVQDAAENVRQTKDMQHRSINDATVKMETFVNDYSQEVTLANQQAIVELEATFYEAHLYIQELLSGETNLDDVHSLVDKFDTQQSQLLNRLSSANDISRLQNIGQNLHVYLDDVVTVIKLNSELAQLSDQLIEVAGSIASQAKELRLLQDNKRTQTTDTAYTLVVAAAVITIIVGIIATLTISSSIVVPLKSVLHTAQQIGSGDLTSDVHSMRKDEIGQLLVAFGSMTKNLREIISTVKHSSTQLAASASELSAVTEQTSVNAQNQKQQTDQVAAAMHQMTITVAEVARNTETTAAAVHNADKQVSEANTTIVTAISKVDELSSKMTQSSTAMESLVSSSDQIGSIMDVIKGIAEQTNLLALNAAIEAARAGESGRGFAVVADEVRNLAQRTHESTNEIERLIEKLQSTAGQASSQVKESYDATKELVDLIGEVNVALNTISQLTGNIRDMDQQIATAAEEQTTVAEDINRNIISVRDEAEQAAAANEQTVSASVELAKLGHELQDTVAGFKV
ncbi:methyl-accepting chemotaxis protein [Shewanella yunxiaonensis]|uniref:Methyl-accepting chemotaxis protein n=1 Tax=Shewanella yunxiaonensis TaxID=2829809 RepID=A0ABX7YWS4_9GAMM|nr:methyl-accepting chemotaxis protein [Shewanella yunxiaonensis]QUN07245.1 methyl-accepting chemotaxis protein [Shewanella yunxiaonensis]